jgi:hypothetical protein
MEHKCKFNFETKAKVKAKQISMQVAVISTELCRKHYVQDRWHRMSIHHVLSTPPPSWLGEVRASLFGLIINPSPGWERTTRERGRSSSLSYEVPVEGEKAVITPREQESPITRVQSCVQPLNASFSWVYICKTIGLFYVWRVYIYCHALVCGDTSVCVCAEHSTLFKRYTRISES